MAEVKDKFEKGMLDSNKPRAEKRLDFRVQTGLASSKKQAFEQGEFEQEVDAPTNKVQIETELLVAGLTSAKKQAFEQQQIDASKRKTSIIEHDVLAGAAKETKAKFERGEFDQDPAELRSRRQQQQQSETDLLVGVTTEKKAKFENGHLSDRSSISSRTEEIATIVGAGLAQAKRSELLSKIDAEQQIQRSFDRPIDIDAAELGLATTRRDQLASLASSEFKSKEKHIDVAAGLASTAREQFMADASKTTAPKAIDSTMDVESGLAKSRATVFENPDETAVSDCRALECALRVFSRSSEQ